MATIEQRGVPTVASARACLTKCCTELIETLGDELLAVILYGSLAKGEFDPLHSDVNVMIVLRQVDVAALERIAPSFHEGVRDCQLAPLVLSERDLQRSADVFPIKFLDMQRHHEVLHGEDVLAELKIAPDHLRLRAEQQIKNLLLRLRLLYLRRGQRAEWVQDTLTRSVAPLISSLDVMLRLRGGSAPAGKSEIAVAAAQAFGLDGRVLRDLLALKAGTYAPDDAELRRMYGAFMTFVDRVADAVDRL